MIKTFCDACGRECSTDSALPIEIGEATFTSYSDPAPGTIHLCAAQSGHDVGCNQLFGAALAWVGNQAKEKRAET